MRLKSIEVQNYRSIVSTTRLELAPGLSVLIGPNNEGKSNILRALELAFECLTMLRVGTSRAARFQSDVDEAKLVYRNPSTYDWLADFPMASQDKHPDGLSRILVEFELTDHEQEMFRQLVGSSTNSSLPLEFELGSRFFTFNIRKKGVREASTTRAMRISRFLRERFEFQYIPAIRPANLSIKAISELVDRELAILNENADYVEAFKVIANMQKPIYDRLGKKVQANLKLLLPSIKSVKISLPEVEGSRRPRLASPTFTVDDGTATGLEAKGDGIKSLVAIALMRASSADTRKGDFVVAIEEPESHLHPDAVHQLSRVLEEMAAEHQVIVTTHSPLLVVRGQIGANIIVARSTANAAKSIKELRDCLGVRMQDNLRSAEYMIMVEGECDSRVLEAMLPAISTAFAAISKTGRIGWDPLKGTGNVAYKISQYRQSVITPYLIVDDDLAGRHCIERAKTEGKMPNANTFLLPCSGLTESEIEDHYDPDKYWSTFERLLGGKPDLSTFKIIPGKWSSKARIVATRAGKPWDDRIEEDIKSGLAAWIAEDPLGRTLPSSHALFASVANAIASAINPE